MGRANLPITALDLTVLATLSLVVGLAVHSVWVPHNHLHGDGATYATNARAFLETGGFRLEGHHGHSWYEADLGWNHTLDSDFSNIAVDTTGGWRPKHPILLPIFASPVLAAWGPGALLYLNIVGVVLSLFGGFRLARRLLPDVGPMPALVGLLALAPWPLFMGEANGFSNDVFYTALIVWGVERTVAGKIGIGGLLLGLGVFAKQTNILVVAPLALWLLSDMADTGRRVRFVIACALPVVAIAVVDTVWFGAPHITGYSRVLTRTDGVQTLTDHADRFAAPSWAGVRRLWYTKINGLRTMFPAAPLLIAGPIVALRGGLPRGFLAAMLVAVVAHTAFLSGYDYVHARFFTVAAVLSVGTVGSALCELSRLVTTTGPAAPAPQALEAEPAQYRRQLLTGLAAALVLAIVIGTILRNIGTDWRLSDHVDEANVTLVHAEKTIPCDHFNQFHQKWECAKKESSSWSMWGRALGAQCQVAGAAGPGVWLHVQPNKMAKSLAIALPKEATALVLQAALSDRTKKPLATVLFFVDDKLVWKPRLDKRGVVLRAVVRSGETLRIEVPGQPHDWQQLCVEVTAPDSP